jgi:hypothetical protein
VRYIQKLNQKYSIKNLDFLFYCIDDLTRVSVIKSDTQLKKIRDIPAFMFSKNIDSVFEKNKLLLPDPYVVTKRWGNIVNQISEFRNNFEWSAK